MKFGSIMLLWALLVSLVAGGTALAAEDIYYYHTDAAGTPLAMSNAAGQKVWEADYKPFGEEYSVSGSKESDRRFVGKEKDEETGLNYFGARYLAASTGRFLAPDSVRAVDAMTGKLNTSILQNPQGVNLYTYSFNNPYRFVDPDGRVPLDTIWDLGNIIYDIITGDKVGLAADSAAFAIPYVPAGISKFVKGVDKAIDASKTVKDAEKFSRAPKSLMDQMVLDAAKQGKGVKIIENLNDPQFKGMEKWSYTEKTAGGLRSEVHYVRNPETGELMDFKFKHHAE